MPEQLRISASKIYSLQRFTYPKLSGINIVEGCGRLCRICSENSPANQTSMHFDALEQLFSTYSGDKQLMLFRKGDPIYYQDGFHLIKDVFALALEYNVNVVARTHGCLRRETKITNAVKELVNFLIENQIDPKIARLDFSVDEYGWFGVSPEEHRASIAAFYQLIAPLDPNVFVFHNPNAEADEIGSYQRLNALLHATHIPSEKTSPQEIYYFQEGDRPSKLHPKPPPKDHFFEPWTGAYIEADGTVLHNHPRLGITKEINIFT
jgi:hypothetical protein